MKHNIKPRADIADSKEAFYLYLDLPGVSEKELNIDVEDHVLSVKAEEKLSSTDKKRYHARSYEARYELGESIDVESIKAKLDHGVLRLELPKIQKKSPSKIKIEVA